MFPEDIHFSVRPQQLQQAVDSLPEPKGRPRKGTSKVRDIRKKLLQVPIEKLAQWKMKANMLDVLPYLAAEDNQDLQERVLVIAINGLPTMKNSTLMRLLPFLYREMSFVEVLNARFIANPPDSPAWIKEYWKAFRKKDPAMEIAQRMISTGVKMTEIKGHLGMISTNELYLDIVGRYISTMDLASLKREPYQDVLACCRGGFPLSSRRNVVHWLLGEYLIEEHSLSVLQEGGPVRELLLLALDIFQKYDWEKLPPSTQSLANALRIEQQLFHLLGHGDSMRRARWWRRWVNFVDEIHYHRPSGKIFLFCGDFVCVEAIAVPLWLHIYPKDELLRNIQAKIWQSMPFNITIPSVEKQRIPGWQLQFDDWMKKRCKGRPERW